MTMMLIFSTATRTGLLGLGCLFALLTLPLQGPAAEGKAKPRVLEANEVSEGKYPSVGRISGMTSGDFCTGTLIDDNFVLTAKHCVEGENPDLLVIKLRGVLRQIVRIYLHPTLDIALLELEEAIPASEIQPSPLLETVPIVGERITLAGFGYEGNGTTGENSDTPPPGRINEGYNTISRLTATEVVSTFDIGDAFQGHGDSGSGVFVERDGVLTVAAVTSNGGVTYGSTEYDVRVDIALGWIMGILGSPVGQFPVISSLTYDGAPSDILTTFANLHATAFDPQDGANVTYLWSVIPPSAAPARFGSSNGTTAARDIRIDFDRAGAYTVLLQVIDSDGHVATRRIILTVLSASTGAHISPGHVSVRVGSQVVFLIGQIDQFGMLLSAAPVRAWSVSGGGQITNTGIFSATLAGPVQTVTATLVSGTILTATVQIVDNNPPAILSAPTASPNPAQVGAPVRFAVAASDSDSSAISFSWNFGDGQTAVGAFPSHVYSFPGQYTATVTIDDGLAPVSAQVTVQIGSPAGMLSVKKLNLRLRFTASGQDRLTIQAGFSPAPLGFDPAKQELALDIGGFVTTFTGSGSRLTNDHGQLTWDRAMRSFRVSLRNLDLKGFLQDEGLSPAAGKLEVDLPVSLTLGGRSSATYSGIQGVAYSGTASAGGAREAR